MQFELNQDIIGFNIGGEIVTECSSTLYLTAHKDITYIGIKTRKTCYLFQLWDGLQHIQ